jgi:hypothetical protein
MSWRVLAVVGFECGEPAAESFGLGFCGAKPLLQRWCRKLGA